ncbi:MAG: class I adenylate-forming enzyme family protein [Pseudomonadota bacterium]
MQLSGAALAAPVTMEGILAQGVGQDPDETALISLETSWTWQELDEDSSRLAGNLLDLGLEPGDRVAVLLPNRCAVVVIYLACLKAGLVATPLSYRYAAPEIDRALKVSEAKILISHRERADDLAAAQEVANLPLGTIGYGQGSLGGLRFETLIEQEPKQQSFPELPDEALAFLFFASSGGKTPRGIAHSRASVGWALASLMQGYALEEEDVVMTASALSHSGGMTLALASLAAGARVAIARNLDGDELLPLLRAERPTVTWMLPAALNRLLRDHEASARDFASLRLVLAGGDRVPDALAQRLESQIGLPLCQSYGFTQASCAALNLPTQQGPSNCIGALMPGCAAEIRDEAGAPLPPHREGHLWVTSKGVMQGYWHHPKASAAAVQEGWLDSGTRAKADAQGRLWLAGPQQQIVVHDFSSIAAKEVEAVLAKHPAVAAAGVVGLLDLLHGETLRAFVTLAENAEPVSEHDLIAYTRARIRFRAPEEIVFLDELPLDDEGEADHDLLKQLAERGWQSAARLDARP